MFLIGGDLFIYFYVYLHKGGLLIQIIQNLTSSPEDFEFTRFDPLYLYSSL